MQKTQLNRNIQSILNSINDYINSSWRKKLISITSLLFGYYIIHNLITYFIDKSFNSILLVIFLVIIIEILIRVRLNFISKRLKIILEIADNFRIGSTYALILEAFKLGS